MILVYNMREPLTELQKTELNSLMIYDPSDEIAELVYNIKQAICEEKVYYIKRAQDMSLKDLKVMENMIANKIREKHKATGLIIGCYFQNITSLHKYYYPISKLIISIRVLCSGGTVLQYRCGKL